VAEGRRPNVDRFIIERGAMHVLIAVLAVLLEAASSVRVGAQFPANLCAAHSSDGSAALQFQMEVQNTDGSPHRANDTVVSVDFHYFTSRPEHPWRRVLSSTEGQILSEDLARVMRWVQSQCTDPYAARMFVSNLIYDLLRQVLLAFASDVDACEADFGNGVTYSYEYRCVPWGFDYWDHQVMVRNSDGEQIHQLSTPAGAYCPGASARWSCDMLRVRGALWSAWSEMMSIRPEQENDEVFKSVLLFLGCVEGASLLECTAPALLRQRISLQMEGAPHDDAVVHTPHNDVAEPSEPELPLEFEGAAPLRNPEARDDDFDAAESEELEFVYKEKVVLRAGFLDAALLAALPTKYLAFTTMYSMGRVGLAHHRARATAPRAAFLQASAGEAGRS